MTESSEQKSAQPKRLARWKKLLIGALLLLVFSVLCLGFIAAWAGAETFVHARNADLEVAETSEHAEFPERTTSHTAIDCDDVVIDSILMEPTEDERAAQADGAVDTVIILHGKADRKESMAGLGRRFIRAGVRAILMDMRGHGASTVTELTYGARDREDLSCVLDHYEAELGTEVLGELGVYGASYGGAVALQFAGTDARVDKAVAVAAFRSFPHIARTSIELSSIAQWAVISAAGMRAGFTPSDASPEAHIGGTEADVVLVYSVDDDIVPYEHGQAVLEACGDHCEILRLSGYDHLGTLSNPELRDRLHRHLAGLPYP